MKISTVAVDVGYGNTKSAFGMGAEISTQMFPSLAPPTSVHSLASHSGSFFRARNVVNVMVDGARYEVGPDVSISAAYGNTGRVLSEDFVTTPNYAALLAGALHYANASEIDRLVLGLPVHNTQKYADFLRDRFSGDLDFGDKLVRVRSVLPLPQPLGSLVSFMQQSGQQYDPDNSYLVIDVGYFTTDWVVARGYAMDDTRSGGVPGGAARVYQQVAKLLSEAEGEAVDSLERIDKAIRDAKPLLFYGKDLDVRPFLAEAMAVTHQSIKEVQTRVGRTEDIRAIILTGGGASLYAPTIRAAFPRNIIHVMDAPCFANVRGFYTIGAARQPVKAAA
ncbi:plasmid segregation protein ParM (plasmid) [Cupriavidus sp. USMAA2-4]|jgi:plasmid segregation protein ParM|uniref:PRTRC system protein D n=1 Tax=Cupriavidus sp. USMAA2-4 TaxID=876364 RepID=UPI0008A6E41E|nr:PRTRC system protein D [Cupriavidus sp. USMAA2-4]AOY97728.1 plasmid segregation protein ParM [Cupriavidus sp. USMAA2-4]